MASSFFLVGPVQVCLYMCVCVFAPLDAHGHGTAGHAAHGPEAEAKSNIQDLDLPAEEVRAASHSSHSVNNSDVEKIRAENPVLDSPVTQILGVAILEFGVVLHRSVILCFDSFRT